MTNTSVKPHKRKTKTGIVPIRGYNKKIKKRRNYGSTIPEEELNWAMSTVDDENATTNDRDKAFNILKQDPLNQPFLDTIRPANDFRDDWGLETDKKIKLFEPELSTNETLDLQKDELKEELIKRDKETERVGWHLKTLPSGKGIIIDDYRRRKPFIKQEEP